MPCIAYTPEEAAINGAALVLRQWAADQQPRPTTYGWADQFVYRSGSGLGTYPLARQLAPGLPERLQTEQELTAWTIGVLGRRVSTSGEPSAFVPLVGWQERLARQTPLTNQAAPTVAALAAAWVARPSPHLTVGAVCEHLGISRAHRTNVTNALNGKRESLPEAQRILLGSYLL